ncbi:hypothetical protein [Blastopirellula retiformator]|uniref:Uncharacterized protein n=1 Tax=Blastopirellula retiformator TaxID=2527970 RepID=A0A5C5VLC8_9BACT|nr:hypothetical protein [Blastopirellula retiformator]TWT38635.1 hypothetical protein Enr8_03280 [Blastopirellula retiformator]
MQIDISPADWQKLEQLAKDTGFESVESLIGEHVRFLANHESARDILSLDDDELAASAAMCDCGMAELDAGRGKDAIAAMEEIGRQRGFSPE